MCKRIATFAVITFALLVCLSATTTSACPEDFDGNGRVDITDFLAFVNVFGSGSAEATYNAQMDLNSNGSVDIADFLAFVNVFGTECSGDNGGSSNAFTRTAFEASTSSGYTAVNLKDNGTVWGVPTQYTDDSDIGTVAYMLLAKLKGCSFADAEADRGSKVYIKTQALGSLPSFASETVCRKTSSSYGAWPRGVRIIHLRFFDESSPSNIREAVYNASTGQIELGGNSSGSGGSPDLIVDSPSVSDSTLTTGQSFTLGATVRNQGNGQSAATTLHFYRSSNATILTSDTEVDTDSVSGLAASAISDESIRLTAPASSGTYYYGACVESVSGESNTDNNCSTGVRVTVSSSGGGETPPSSTPVSFALYKGNNNPGGIAYANNRFYVIDGRARKVFAYTISGQRDASTDFDLDKDHKYAGNILYANNRFYVLDEVDKKVYAYTISGQRDASADFDLDKGNDDPTSITYANNRFYVIDADGLKVFAHTISGQRDASTDFDLDKDHEYPGNISYANNRFYVVERDQVYVYAISGQRDASADFDLDKGPTLAAFIYANNRFYAVEYSDDFTERCKVSAYTISGQRDASADFDLEDSINYPRGITYANNRFYVTDKYDRKVYAYTISGQRDASADFDMDKEGLSDITYANNRFYVPAVRAESWGDDWVYVYTSSGQRDASKDFDLDKDHINVGGITYANNQFYVTNIIFELLPGRINPVSDKVYAYTISGQRDASADFDTDKDNGWPEAITYANNRLYVVDFEDRKVYAYTISGQRDASADFNLDKGNRWPEGITYVNNRFCVVDDDSVYVYTSDGRVHK